MVNFCKGAVPHGRGDKTLAGVQCCAQCKSGTAVVWSQRTPTLMAFNGFLDAAQQRLLCLLRLLPLRCLQCPLHVAHQHTGGQSERLQLSSAKGPRLGVGHHQRAVHRAGRRPIGRCHQRHGCQARQMWGARHAGQAAEPAMRELPGETDGHEQECGCNAWAAPHRATPAVGASGAARKRAEACLASAARSGTISDPPGGQAESSPSASPRLREQTHVWSASVQPPACSRMRAGSMPSASQAAVRTPPAWGAGAAMTPCQLHQPPALTSW